MKLKAASLIQAIFISLIISIFCLGLLTIFNFNFELKNYYGKSQDLIYLNRSLINSFLLNNSKIDNSKNSRITDTKWGVFKIYTFETFSVTDTVSQKLLVSKKRSNDNPVLYLKNNDEPLKISGNTNIEGDIYIPKDGLKKIRINNQNSSQNPKHFGKIYVSEKKIPRLNLSFFEFPETIIEIEYKDIDGDTLINRFNDTPIVVNASNKIDEIFLKGNIILKSNDTLSISNNTKLEDIIVIAPKIIIEKDFQGIIQVFADTEIEINENVQLDYPSILYLNNKSNNKSQITVRSGVNINGAIILNTEDHKNEQNSNLIIEEDVNIKGDIYCKGKLSTLGNIQGNIITSGLLSENENGTYTNTILGGTISNISVSENLFGLPTTDFEQDSESIAIKQL